MATSLYTFGLTLSFKYHINMSGNHSAIWQLLHKEYYFVKIIAVSSLWVVTQIWIVCPVWVGVHESALTANFPLSTPHSCEMENVCQIVHEFEMLHDVIRVTFQMYVYFH